MEATFTGRINPESATKLTKVLNRICADIAEVCILPRVTKMAQKLGITAGYVMVLTT